MTDRTSMERTSETELVWKRTLGAPAKIVFEAYTKPEHVRRWWASPARGVEMSECVADVRAGGTYRYVLTRGGKVLCAFSGTYVEITRPTRIVYTQRLEPGTEEAVVTVTFTERAGSTDLVSHERYPSKEALDGAIASGMEEGARETLEALAALVMSLSA